MGFRGGSDGKESGCNVGDLGYIPGSGRSPGEGTATHSSVLAWRIPRTVEPGGLESMGSHRVGHDWDNLAQHTLISITIIEELLWGVSENRTLRPVPIHHPTLLFPLVSCEFFHCLCKLKKLNIFLFLLFLQKMRAVVILQFVFIFNKIL